MLLLKHVGRKRRHGLTHQLPIYVRRRRKSRIQSYLVSVAFVLLSNIPTPLSLKLISSPTTAARRELGLCFMAVATPYNESSVGPHPSNIVPSRLSMSSARYGRTWLDTRLWKTGKAWMKRGQLTGLERSEECDPRRDICAFNIYSSPVSLDWELMW